MRKLLYSLTIAFIAMLIFSCASGTALVTGTQRPATTADKVVVYTEPPKDYEVIGIVTASSDAGWTEQGDLDYAMAELKKQAAKIGANGVILQSISTSNSGGAFVGSVWVNSTAKNVSGTAIYVQGK